MDKTDCCATCKFGRPVKDVPAAENIVACHRYPPQVILVPAQQMAMNKRTGALEQVQGLTPMGLYPTMQGTDWCGEHQTPALLNG